ncbi:MAG: restriction endonuclease, partial [Candidatus Cloacimonadota bacterium]
MKYPTIRIEGSILSADILDKIQQGELLGQKPKDFWLEGSGSKVKDEIVKAWADAQDMWRIYQRKIESIPDNKTGTTETRNFWMVPFLSLLGYDMQLYRSAQNINNKSYAISHNASNLDTFPIHIMGFNDSLDKKRRDSGPRMSPHALVQEYINLNEHLYALVTNGLTIRLLRDSSRLIKLSFLEFDLERMFNEDHYTDFAIMYRLLHASRMPKKQAEGSESLIEGYHQDSLDSGSRIREGLSNAVEISIESIANGFLSHPDNNDLRQHIQDGDLTAVEYYSNLLHLIYRLLFLMVIEERGLIFADDVPKEKRDIYYNYYSLNRIRNLSEKRYLAEAKYADLWISIKNTFRLFETEYYGEKLQIKPLAGDLFGSNAIGVLNNCSLDNKVLLNCLKNLSAFTNPNNGQIMRVNYGSLNTEEFGSVYENLLEYDPHLDVSGSTVTFSFIKGTGRSSSGSHYTPDELVQPLIKHSLDYIIEDKLKDADPEKALLSIT